MPNYQGRKMVTNLRIRKYWATRLVEEGKFDSVEEVMEEDYCFACGFFNHKTERAHILARCLGGPDTVENLHLLCSLCHLDSELINGEAYWRWFRSRTIADVGISALLRSGKNVWAMIAGINNSTQNSHAPDDRPTDS